HHAADRRLRHRHRRAFARAARPPLRAGREPAHQELSRLGPGTGNRAVADPTARRLDEAAFAARYRHGGPRLPAARSARPEAEYPGGSLRRSRLAAAVDGTPRFDMAEGATAKVWMAPRTPERRYDRSGPRPLRGASPPQSSAPRRCLPPRPRAATRTPAPRRSRWDREDRGCASCRGRYADRT